MTTVIGAAVRIGGNSREAVTALQQTGQAAAQASSALRGMASTALGSAAGLVSAGAAWKAFRMGAREARAILSAYLDSNEEARAATNAFSESLKEARAAMGEAVLGGGVLQDAMSLLTQATQRMSSSASANSDALQALARGALAASARAAGIAAQVLAELYAGLEGGVLVVRGAVAVIAMFGDQLAALAAAAVETARMLTGYLFSSLGTLLNISVRTYEAIGITLPQGLRDAANAMQRFGDRMVETSDPMRELRIGVEASAERMRNLGEAAEGMSNRVDGARAAAALVRSELEDLAAQVDAGTLSHDVLTQSVQRMTGAMRQQAETVAEAIKALEGYDAILASVQAKEAGAAQLRKAQEDAAFAEQMAQLEAMTRAREEAEQRALEAARAAAAERLEMQQASAQAAAQAASVEYVALIQGQKTAAEAVKGFIGNMLQMKGGAYLAEGAALAFVPGMQLAGLGLIARATAMIGLGAKLSGAGAGAGQSASPAATGAAPMQAQQAPSVTNRTTTINTSIGFAGDPRESARMVLDATRRGMREGA